MAPPTLTGLPIMHYFTVDSRSSIEASSGACSTCCCEAAKGIPGETNPWQINYSPWSLPIGGLGLVAQTEFFFEQVNSDSANLPTNTHYGYATDTAIVVNGDVSTNAAVGAALGALAGGAIGSAVDSSNPEPVEQGGWQ